MDYQRRYPLHHAIYYEDLEEVKRLSQISHYLNEEDNDDETPCYVLTKSSSQEFAITAAECLLKAGADPNKGTDFSKLPLHRAIRSNKLELVKLFLQYGADPNKRGKDNDIEFRDYKGNHSIHCVINLDNLIDKDYNNEILKLLFMHPDIQLNEKNSLGEEFLDSLVYKVVFLKYAYKNFGWMPLESIVLWNVAEIIESLILAGVDPEKSSLYYPGIDSKTFTYLEDGYQAVLQSQIEKNYEQLKTDQNSLVFGLEYNQAVLMRVIQEEVYLFFRETIEEALKFKEAETAKLGTIKDPQIIKQFLLASEKEKTSLLREKQQLQFSMALEEEKAQLLVEEHPAEEVRLKRLDGAITARFLLSSVQDRKEFLFQINWLDKLCVTIYDRKYNYLQELRKNVPLLAAALTLPEEVFRIILKYLLPNPNRMFLFLEEPIEMSKQQPAEIRESTNIVSPRLG